MVGTMNINPMAEFYEKVLGRPADMSEDEWKGWQVGSSFFGLGVHSETAGLAKDPSRIIFNFETADVKDEFERIKGLGATVVKEPYEMGAGMWVATFADPDGNLFQLMSPWEGQDK